MKEQEKTSEDKKGKGGDEVARCLPLVLVLRIGMSGDGWMDGYERHVCALWDGMVGLAYLDVRILICIIWWALADALCSMLIS